MALFEDAAVVVALLEDVVVAVVVALLEDVAVAVVVVEDVVNEFEVSCDDECNDELSRFDVSLVKICLMSDSIQRLSASSKIGYPIGSK